MRHKMAWQATLEYIRETDTFLVNTNNKSMTNYHDMKNHFFEKVNLLASASRVQEKEVGILIYLCFKFCCFLFYI